jgi:hypothetical protein
MCCARHFARLRPSAVRVADEVAPLFPLALALPTMLQEIEAALITAGPAETRRLRRRAELIRGLLAPNWYRCNEAR